jgi:prepilin-type N-terminal cleavage/methylation domain-containing protein
MRFGVRSHKCRAREEAFVKARNLRRTWLVTSQGQAGFTLLEVVIAIAIFFIAVFTILDLTSRCLRSARALQHSTVNATSLAAELSLTNRLTEGFESGDFGDLYPGYTWAREISMVSTNGLFEVDFSVLSTIGKPRIESEMSILLYRPDSMAASVQRVGGGRR